MQMKNNKIGKEQIENLYSIMAEIVDEDVICTKLLEGWILINYGHGWFLQAPYVPYKNQEALKVDKEVVREMFDRGLLDFEGWQLDIEKGNKENITRGYLTESSKKAS